MFVTDQEIISDLGENCPVCDRDAGESELKWVDV